MMLTVVIPILAMKNIFSDHDSLTDIENEIDEKIKQILILHLGLLQRIALTITLEKIFVCVGHNILQFKVELTTLSLYLWKNLKDPHQLYLQGHH